MKTDDLIDLLASGPDVRVEAPPPQRDLAPLLLGVCGSVAVMLATLGIRRDLFAALGGAIFWIKVAFAGSLAWAAIHAARRLAVPGAPLGRTWLWIALPFLAIWTIAAAVLWQAAPDARAALLLGRSWRVCPFWITVVSLPVFGAALAVMRRRAPTRPALAGAAAGLAAGAVGTLVYCLHCPESSAAFVAVWYVLGLLAPAALGVLIGSRLLRW